MLTLDALNWSAGNAHTPHHVAWLGRLIPGSFGTIEQEDLGRAFVAEIIGDPAHIAGSILAHTHRALVLRSCGGQCTQLVCHGRRRHGPKQTGLTDRMRG
jgi:hypothetical protein